MEMTVARVLCLYLLGDFISYSVQISSLEKKNWSSVNFTLVNTLESARDHSNLGH